MRPVTISQTGVGNSAPIVHDYQQSPFNCSLSTVVSGTVNYTIQHTYDDVFSPTYNAASGNWFDNAAPLAGATANAEGSYNTPVTASRIKVNSGSGTVTLKAIQGITLGN